MITDSEQQQSQSPSSRLTSYRPRKQRKLRPALLIFLVVLAVLVALAAVFGFRLLEGGTYLGLTPGNTTGFPSMQSGVVQVNGQAQPSLYMQYKQMASLYVAHMTLDEELGQLIMVQYNENTYSPDLDKMINKLYAGGVIMYEFQIQTLNQTRQDIARMQQRSFLPLLISTDEEGGPYVQRLSNIYGQRMSATEIYQTGDPNVATEQGQQTAHDLLSLGLNTNLAPDVDVNLVNGYDMLTRTFGNTPDAVIKFAGAYLKALQGSGVIGCIKHYPGLGAAVSDAHTGLPVVNRTKSELYAVELAPFKAFIQSPDMLENPGMIMSTDVLMPAIDAKYPAELSHSFMTDILRNQFGYDGVVLTDSLYMGGIAQQWTLPEAAVLAIKAGNDMLLGPAGSDQMVAVINALKAALQDGTLSKARIDEAATRIIALKMEYHLMPAVPPQS